MVQQQAGCPFCGASARPTARYCPQCGRLLQTSSAAVDELPGGRLSSDPSLVPGDRIGTRYSVEQRLGAGAFGETYLARDHAVDGRLCVVKRMRVQPHWSTEECRLRVDAFLHEVRMLAGINHPGHPNIPEIFDHLPAERCLVMKYITGTSLSDVLQTTGLLPLEAALRCARDICSALVYLHGRRAEPVLHRDIKPANLMQDERGHYWLIDFGLAFALPARTGARVMPLATAGTPGYAPPEQWVGRAEPRSDVYALAMTLYALVAGRLPASQELEARSGEERATWIAATLPPGLPPQLGALLGRALARDVAVRPSAEELYTELTALLEICTLPEPLPPSPPPAIKGFIGRDAELQGIRERLAITCGLLLYGPAGVGKSTLAAEAALHLAQANDAWWFTCLPLAGDDQLLWSLAEFLGYHGLREPWARLQIARRSGQPPPPPEHLLALIAHALRAGTWERPLLLIWDALDRVIDQPPVRRLWEELCALARPDRLRLLATMRRVPPSLAGQPAMPIGGLTPDAAGMLLDRRGLRLDRTLVDRLSASTGGNPQLIVLATTLLGRPGNDPAAAIDQLVASEDVQRYVTHQIDHELNAAERAVMQALAVLGEEGGPQGAITAVAASDILAPLQTLRERGLVEVLTERSQRVYRQPGLIADFYLARLEDKERELQRRAADYFARQSADPLRAARHYLAAEDSEVAAALVASPFVAQLMIGQGRGRAFEQLLARLPVSQLGSEREAAVAIARAEALILLGEYQSARRLLRSALAGDELSPEEVPPETRAYRWRLLARLEAQNGSFEAAERCCRHGLAALAGLTTPYTERARLFTELATVLMRLGRTAEASAACWAGLSDLPRRPAAPRERAALLHRLATIAGEEGDYDQAIVALEQTLALARAVGDLVLIAAVLHNLGTYRVNRGERALALAAYRESLAIEEQAGNLAGQATTLDGMATLAMDLGDLTAAIGYFNASRALCERLGLREDLAWTLGNLGQLHLIKGDSPAAVEYLTRARALHLEMSRPLGAADATYRLGDVALAAGEPDRARAYGEEALALARQATSRAYESCALRVLGEAALAKGDRETALRRLAAALAAQRRVGDPYDTALILAAGAKLAASDDDTARCARRAQRAGAHALRSGVPHLVAQIEQLATLCSARDK